ncbi:EF-hand domain-containing protein [Roseovarius sp. D22-M7]|uniref:EF-hand domain-containing protein n=1 Tax=Roseovarius sp. D22-M7 TaxID=3127116 RepID=UPI00300FAEAA
MTKKMLATGLAMTLALPALAQGLDFDTLDANGDGFVTMAEFQAAMPDVSVDAFMEADTNADGALSQDELAAAQEEGILPAGDE